MAETPKLKPRLDNPGTTPMIMQVGRSHLLWLINKQLMEEGKPELPPETEVTFKVPGGGDFSNEEVSLNNQGQILTFRWRQ